MADNQTKNKAWECANAHRSHTTANASKRNSPAAGAARGFLRDKIPDPVSYYEAQGLTLQGPRNAPWKTTECRFHGGSDSMRVNVSTGAWVCMACGAKGGDVLSHLMLSKGIEFVDAAKELGAWTGSDSPHMKNKPAGLSPRAAMEVLSFEALIAAVAAANVASGVVLTKRDLERLLLAANRITKLVEGYQ